MDHSLDYGVLALWLLYFTPIFTNSVFQFGLHALHRHLVLGIYRVSLESLRSQFLLRAIRL